MRAAVLTGRRIIEIKDIPAPEPNENQVIVRAAYTGICGTEQHIWNGEFEQRVKYPAVLGHEFGGYILKTGRNVTGFKEGDKVVVDPIISCHTCPACHEGRFNACRSLKLRGVDLPGGMAEEVVCDLSQVFRYPDHLPMEHSPMAELYSIACHCAVRARIRPADTVAVFGAGKVGLSVIDVFRQMGISRLFAVDTVDDRLAKAAALGADRTINPRHEDPVAVIREATDGTGVDLAVEAVGHYDEIDGILPPVAAAGEALRNAGRLVVLGQGPQHTPVFFKTLVWKEIDMVMSRVSLGEFPRAVRLMDRGLLHPDKIISGVFPLEKTGEMFERLEKDKAGLVKVVLKI